MTDNQRAYLAVLESDPTLKAAAVAEKIGVTKKAYDLWRARYPAFRDEVDRIKARWRLQQAEKETAEAFAAVEPPEEPSSTELSPELARFIEVFELTGDRMETVDKLKREGHEITWATISAELESNPEFARRFAAVWDQDNIRAEDRLRQKVLKGKFSTTPTLALLKAEMPKKYGDRVKHVVEGTIRLEAHDMRLVEEAKAGPGKRFQQRAARSALKMMAQQRRLEAAPQEPDDVIEGELVEQV